MGRSIRNKPQNKGNGISKSELDAKADVETVTSLQAIIDTKANVSQINELQNTMDSKASVESVNAVETLLGTKANTEDVDALQDSVNDRVTQTDFDTFETNFYNIVDDADDNLLDTDDLVYIEEAYYKGSRNLSLANFKSNWDDYDWHVHITPTVIGYETYSFQAPPYHYHPYGNIDYSNHWDNDDSEYHYGYISGTTLWLYSRHLNHTTWIDLIGRYHLIGVKKTSTR